MSHLLALPLHLVEDIIGQLCLHCHPPVPQTRRGRSAECNSGCIIPSSDFEPEATAALASLCRVNKTLNAVATPLLYHQPPCATFNNPSAFWAFKNAIARGNPALGHHVRSLHIPFPKTARRFMRAEKIPGSADDYQFVDACAAGDLSYTGCLSSVDMLTAFAPYCPRLEELCVEVHRKAGLEDDGSQSLDPQVFYPAPGSFPRLKRLHAAMRFLYGLKWENLQPLLDAAPNLESVSVWSLRHWKSPAPALVASAGIRELSLRHCKMGLDSLSRLLEQLPRLERLTWDSSRRIWNDQGLADQEATPRDVAAAIECSAPRLRFLHLHTERAQWEPGTVPWDNDAAVRSLKGLSLLEELRIGFESVFVMEAATAAAAREEEGDAAAAVGTEASPDPLLLVNLLPESIRAVTILGPGPCDLLLSAFLTLKQHVDTDFTGLRDGRMKIELGSVPDEEFSRVRGCFEGSGIEVQRDTGSSFIR